MYTTLLSRKLNIIWLLVDNVQPGVVPDILRVIGKFKSKKLGKEARRE